MPMSKRLEELFNLPTTEDSDGEEVIEEAKLPISQETLDNLDKIDAALPIVKGLDTTDAELDELSNLAKDTFKDLVDLGMNVEARFSSELMQAASQMLGHAITAKTAKANKNLRMIDMQIKKQKLDNDANKDGGGSTASGHVLDRNELLEQLLKQAQNPEK